MEPPIPEVITLESSVALHQKMIFEDPEHRRFTEERFGHPPTGDELAKHWYETGAAGRLDLLLTQTANNRFYQRSARASA